MVACDNHAHETIHIELSIRKDKSTYMPTHVGWSLMSCVCKIMKPLTFAQQTKSK